MTSLQTILLSPEQQLYQRICTENPEAIQLRGDPKLAFYCANGVSNDQLHRVESNTHGKYMCTDKTHGPKSPAVWFICPKCWITKTTKKEKTSESKNDSKSKERGKRHVCDGSEFSFETLGSDELLDEEIDIILQSTDTL